MKTRTCILAVLSVITVMLLTSCAGNTGKRPETDDIPADTTVRTDGTLPTVPAGVRLQITEHKTGYSIAGKELPPQTRTQEFDIKEDDAIYAGLTLTAKDSARCILKIQAIAADTVTMQILEDSQEKAKTLSYGEEYTYTAFTNPDEYAYAYTIEFTDG